MTLSLFLDVVVAVLLVATIFYAAMLNRRLSGLRSNKAELEALIHTFAEACARAEAGVKTLRSATDEATRLQAYLDRSQALRDDLSFLLDRGSGLADRLEGGVRSARVEVQNRPVAAGEPESNRFGRPQRGEPRAGAAPGPLGASPVEPEPMPAPRVRPLRERIAEPPPAAVGAAAEPAPIDAERAAERLAQRVALGERPARVARPLRERANLRAALAQAAGGAAQAPAGPASGPTVVEPPPLAAEPRSKAERELLQALRTRR